MQSTINQFLVSNVLGSTMVPGRRHPFGQFGRSLRTVAEMLKGRETRGYQPPTTLAPTDDLLIVKAFEETRNGVSPDRLLADPVLTAKFNARCKALGVEAAPVTINHRLLQFRKNPPKGIKLARSTERGHPLDHSGYIHASELASKQMNYRRGVTIDDIIADPAIGGEFDHLANTIAPGWTPVEYRLAALYVRKVTRVCDLKDKRLFEEATVASIDAELVNVGNLAEINDCDLPDRPGIYALTEVTENSRDLYISRSEDLRLGVAPFRNSQLFSALGNHLWSPRLEEIQVNLFSGEEFRGVNTRIWELKMINERSPVFNLPIRLRNRKAA